MSRISQKVRIVFDNNIDNRSLFKFYLTSGDVCSQKVLDSHSDVSVVPMLSSKHKVSELVESYILAVV